MPVNPPSDSLLAILNDGRKRQVAPALAAAVGTGDTHFFAATGMLSDALMAPSCSATTRFDLASLTKILSTTLLAALAVHENKIALDEVPFTAWPDVQVRHLLAHNSGLAGWAPFYEHAIKRRTSGLPAGSEAVIERVLASIPEAPPGERTTYSDIGFIALGHLLAGRLHGRLDHLFADVAGRAFGPTGLGFVPLFEDGYALDVETTAPTEQCPWRRRLVQGQVHDDNAFAMGGIAGHAGLFGSVGDVQRAAIALLRMISGPQHDARFPAAATLRSFAQSPGPRPLGFDRPTPGGSTGNTLSSNAVGHLGFTGTSLWLDPKSPVGPAYFVLLTNRVCPTRENDAIRSFRQDFHRRAMSLLQAAT